MTVFETLNAVNVNDRTEIKVTGGTKLTYLSWAWAWAEVKKRYPDAQYQIGRYEGGKPYIYDENAGYMVTTTVTIEGMTHEMWLPVMDGANKAMKSEPYEYTTKYGTKTVEAATMFDINKTIMRCLVKNLAMFGLGLYIYAGEDLPESEEPLEPKVYCDPLHDANRAIAKVTETQVAYAKKLCEEKGMKGCPGYNGTIWEDMTVDQYATAVEALKGVKA